jgi:hypothetical protein
VSFCKLLSCISLLCVRMHLVHSMCSQRSACTTVSLSGVACYIACVYYHLCCALTATACTCIHTHTQCAELGDIKYWPTQAHKRADEGVVLAQTSLKRGKPSLKHLASYALRFVLRRPLQPVQGLEPCTTCTMTTESDGRYVILQLQV